jgi:ankyrin repeat protein
MKAPSMKNTALTFILVAIFSLIVLNGCKDDKTNSDSIMTGINKADILPVKKTNPEKTIAKLTRQSIDFTEENFFENIQYGNIENIKKFINRGIDVNTRNKGGVSALHMASTLGNTEIIKLLLDAGAFIDSRDPTDCSTPLLEAVVKKHKDAVELLIDRGADMNAKKDYGFTPLMTAIWWEDPIITTLLIKKGADTTLKSEYGLSPLTYAILEKKLDMVETLRDADADFDRNMDMLMAIQSDDLKKVKVLLASGAEIDHKTRAGSPLSLATKLGRTDIVKFLINSGGKLNIKDQRDYVPLSIASEKGHTDIVRILLANGAEPNGTTVCNFLCYPDTPLVLAAEMGHLKIIKLLITSGSEVNAISVGHSEGVPHTALHVAAWRDYSHIVKTLLEAGADPTIRTIDNTALEVAKKENNIVTINIIQKALKRWIAQTNRLQAAATSKEKNARKKIQSLGMAFTIKDFMGAVIKGNTTKITLFIDGGVSIDTKDKNAKSALHIASEYGQTDITSFLLKNGASVNEMDIKANTALSIAARNNYTNTVMLLLENGADPNTSCRPLMYAAANGNEKMVQSLLQYGADINSGAGCKFKAYAYEGGPLLQAIDEGHRKIVRVLIENNADVNAVEIDPFEGVSATALMSAAANGHTDIVADLITAGADIERKNYQKTTALMWAAAAGHLKVVKYLLEKGADTNKRGWYGTALDAAIKEGHEEIIAVLKKADSRLKQPLCR